MSNVIAIVDIDKQTFRVFADGSIERIGKSKEAVSTELQATVYRRVVVEMAKALAERGDIVTWRGAEGVSVMVMRGER
jgi:hypothetical protein